MAAVSDLYASAGETVSDLHVRRMQAWLRDRPQDAFGRHRYDPADFGWTYEGLADEFADYAHRYLGRRALGSRLGKVIRIEGSGRAG